MKTIKIYMKIQADSLPALLIVNLKLPNTENEGKMKGMSMSVFLLGPKTCC